MSSSDDEILVIFYEESKEHLETFEDDLLTLEAQGENFDDELMNSIFRAVHTIKGGCSFFGLTKLNSLSHIMETLLDNVRKRKIALNSDIVNVLLKGADLLNIMVEEPERTPELDTDSVINDINFILSGETPPAATIEVAEEPPKEEVVNEPEEVEVAEPTGDDKVQIKLPNGRVVFEIDKLEFEEARFSDKGGTEVYIIEYDLIEDIEKKGFTPWEVINELKQVAKFIDSKIDFEASKVPELKSEAESTVQSDSKIPFYILMSTVVEIDLLYDFLNIPPENIHQISEDGEFLDELSKQLEESYTKTKIESTEELEAQKELLKEDDQPTVKKVADIVPEPVVKETAPAVVKPVQPKPPVEKTSPTKPVAKPAPKKAEGSIRVGLGLLDKLMSLAGELVLARNELLQNTNSQSWEAIITTSQRVDHITIELQEAIMATRLQSIGIVFNKFHRVVRDLSRDLGKDIKLVLEGEGVELDKTIVEAIGDPLTHIVRNSLDHGIETPEERKSIGKEPTGILKISARHEGGHVVIEIVDDGRGVNVERVKAKALENGICTEAQLERMSDKDAIMLIFKPGFSTAEKVTSVSGRGVGMDVVLTNLNKLGGSVDVDSTFGEGTKLKIKLPLTLAIMPSLLIRIGSERYAIPQVNLLELVRIPSSERNKRIEHVGSAVMMRLRERLLPLIDLKSVIKMEDKNFWEREQLLTSDEKVDALNVAVLAAGDMTYGLIVDELLDSSEIVVKPLGRHIKACKEYAGATILGDGTVALILDVVGVAQSMNMQSRVVEDDEDYVTEAEKSLEDKQTVLLVNNFKDEHFAIPLGLVARIEKIHISDIETVSGRKSIKYRGETLVLFSIEEVANVTPRDESEYAYVVVFRIAKREVGLIVSSINDIIDSTAPVDSETYVQTGILGSSIIHDKITLIVDIYGIVYTLMPHWKDEHEDGIKTFDLKEKDVTVLIAEDSKFFMSQLKSFMEEIGFNVLTAEDGALAYDVLMKHSDEIDLVLTDIEMPNMDGIEFTKKIRTHSQFDELPVLAVTSVAGETAEEIGLNAGLDEYLIKLDRDELLERATHYLQFGRGK